MSEIQIIPLTREAINAGIASQKRKAIIEKDEFAAGRSAREIMATVAKPILYCIPDRVPSGLVLIGARPKARKSWWALQLDIATSTGCEFMGRKAEPCRTLGIYLEDNDTRMRHRFEFFGMSPETAPELLHVFHEWDQGAFGVSKIRRWMERYPDTKKITIDILQRFRGAKDPRTSAYEADYAIMGMLHALTVEFPGLTIVVVHHIKKGSVDDPVEALSGTFGIAGGADAYIILNRHDQNRWVAHIDGRDWEAWDHDFLWEFRQGVGWVQLGAFDDDAGLNSRQAEILAMARERGHVTPSEIAAHYKIHRSTAGEALEALVKKNVLYDRRGKYCPTSVSV